jgi:hypothetical protein
MTRFIKTVRAAIFAAVLFTAVSAGAQDGIPDQAAEVEQPKNFKVTSIKDCYDALSPEDAADIRMNYAMPYQECQKRLAARRQARKLAEDKQAAADATPVTPRNFVRVKPLPADKEASTPESEKSGAADAKKD